LTITKLLDRGEIEVSNDSQTTLEACDLASGIALCLYDPANRIAGLAHMLLPTHVEAPTAAPEGDVLDGYFVEVGTEVLVHQMEQAGAQVSMCEVVVVGGATFMTAGAPSAQPLGDRNVRAVTEALGAQGIHVTRYHVGGFVNRGVSIDVATGDVTVR